MGKVYIRSQDREKLYCFGSSFNSLEYSKKSTQKKRATEPEVRQTICISDGCLEEIGEYESKERCLEILDEIQHECENYYKSTCSLDIPDMLFDMPKVYQMPEK